MMLNGALDAIAARMAQAFPALKTCEVHAGRFDADELARISARVPALFVSCLGIPKVTNAGTEQADADAALAVFVLLGSSPGLPRDVAARNVVEALVVLVQNERWGLSGCGETREIRAENLYGGKIDAQGVALWAVSWRQLLRLGASCFDESGTVPSHLYLGIDPDIGPDHVDDYLEVT